MSRGVLVRLLLVLGLLGGCVWLSLEREPRLGIDLRGGTQITLEAQSTETTPANAENVDQAIEVLRGRVDALGVSEPTLARVGENRILVELPDVQNSEEAEAALGKTAQLTIHPVVGLPNTLDEEPSEPQGQVLADEDGTPVEIGPPRLQGTDIRSASAGIPQNSVSWAVSIDFSGDGRGKWRQLTGEAACFSGAEDFKRRIAIVLDGEVISSPRVVDEIGCDVGMGGGATDITGNFTQEEAQNLAILIEGGALPLPVEIIESRQIGPTLGATAIDASWKAALAGLMLTALFIALVYRLVGFLATLALTSYALLAYAMLVGVGATLTLPGLAGFVLAIGLAIDANVLVFERAREEYRAAPQAGLRRALMTGFNKAWSAIIDSNVTTLLAAGLLFFLGSGPIKGFGVTLSIGVIASMISALVIARVLTELAVSSKGVKRRPAITGLSNVGRVRTWLEEKNPDLMRDRKRWLAGSALALVLAFVGIGTGLNLGLEFTGGRVMEYSTARTVTADQARQAIADAGYPEATVQLSDSGNVAVRVGQVTEDEVAEIEQAIEGVGGDATQEIDEKISPSLGEELRNKALIAFGVALAVQMIYLAVRFKWTFGLAAVAAMFHDVVLVVGLFAWLGKPVDGIFLAAAMTIIGLSVNDTVVVFDRIRERWRASRPGEEFAAIANRAAVETVPRTVNTGLGAMFILAALAVFGGDSLRDFAIALLVGLVVGTWSSVFTATPLLIAMQSRWPMVRAEKVKKVRDPNDSGAVV